MSAGGAGAARRIAENPLTVLGLGAGATRMEVERQAQLLLGMLELGVGGAEAYDTPLGPRPRTADLVRAAAAQLRDPVGRLAAELWLAEPAAADAADAAACAAPDPARAAPDGAAPDGGAPNADDAAAAPPPPPEPFPGALAALGWARRAGGAR